MGIRQTDVGEIFQEGGPCGAMEGAAEMVFAHVRQPGGLLQSQLFLIMTVNIVQHRDDLRVHMLPVQGVSLLSVGQKLRKLHKDLQQTGGEQLVGKKTPAAGVLLRCLQHAKKGIRLRLG